MNLVGYTVGDCRLKFADAVICGVVDERDGLHPGVAVADEGIACDPDRVITEHDLVIFVCKTADPVEYRELALRRPRPLPPIEETGYSRTPFDILVCGWRQEWQDGRRLAARAKSLVRNLPDGSRLEFLNLLGPEEFGARMAEGGLE